VVEPDLDFNPSLLCSLLESHVPSLLIAKFLLQTAQSLCLLLQICGHLMQSRGVPLDELVFDADLSCVGLVPQVKNKFAIANPADQPAATGITHE